ncbi:hypothetical protein AO068_02330 [Pseudomonas sp. ICMP 3272]|nr:hypothetical protein AO068_02330 [Pseudomonas sp. ICMP 3272]KTC53963.1 hypothetical protein AO258_02340 [Pseudomonas syringae ICMP 19498]KWS77223.1 hypothetical protein AL052_03040 [Pseudomonas amygdali pv. eriobotryae]KWS86165.1 hypothetical protein AL050_25730 [Pseudomonas syringae pv. daphniphylli]KWS98517.1 hypothetical protein AL048_13510 [Pseudomonas syringae pv. castaneae]
MSPQMLTARSCVPVFMEIPKYEAETTLTIVPTLRVVMQFVTLRVTQLCDSVRFRLDSSHLFAPRRVTLKGPK